MSEGTRGNEPVSPPSNNLEAAFAKLKTEMMSGLRHGFSEMSVSCEIVKSGRRRLTIKSGKSFKYDIPEEDIFGA